MRRSNRAMEIKQIRNAVQRKHLEKSVYGGGQIFHSASDSASDAQTSQCQRVPSLVPSLQIVSEKRGPSLLPCMHKHVPTLSEIAERRDERSAEALSLLSIFDTPRDRYAIICCYSITLPGVCVLHVYFHQSHPHLCLISERFRVENH